MCVSTHPDVYFELGKLMNILTKVSYLCRKLESLKLKAETENSGLLLSINLFFVKIFLSVL